MGTRNPGSPHERDTLEIDVVRSDSAVPVDSDAVPDSAVPVDFAEEGIDRENGVGNTPRSISRNTWFADRILLDIAEVVPGFADELSSDSEKLDEKEPLDELVFARLMFAAGASMASSTEENASHNVNHVKDVMNRACSLIEELERRGVKLSLYDKQCVMLASAWHDNGHSGKIGYGPDFDKNIVTALNSCYESMRELGVGIAMKKDVLKIIAATTSFDKRFKPTKVTESLVVLADIGSFIDGYDAFMINNLRMAAEVDPSKMVSFEDFAKFTIGFLERYCVEVIAKIGGVFAADEDKREVYLEFLAEIDTKRSEVLKRVKDFIETPDSEDKWLQVVNALITRNQGRLV